MSKESVLQSLEVAETLEDLEKAVHVTLRKYHSRRKNISP